MTTKKEKVRKLLEAVWAWQADAVEALEANNWNDLVCNLDDLATDAKRALAIAEEIETEQDAERNK